MDLMKRIGVGTVLVVGFLLPHDEGIAQDLTAAIQTGRMTVVDVNREAQRLVCMNSQGRVSEHRVTNGAKVVTENKTASDLALLNTGDVIRAELRAGRIQKIVVLRQAWHETASPE
jgi:hypothetical protein